MNQKTYYRKYNEILNEHELLSRNIALKGLSRQFKAAASIYLQYPNTPVQLLVKESDTLNIFKEIYDSIGIEMATFVDSTFPKQKSSGLVLQTKAKKPKQYQIDNSAKINYWKEEFLRFTQSQDCADKVTKVTNTTKQQIRDILNKAGETGASHKQVARSILELGGEINTKRRATLIARTENAIGSNRGAMFAAKSSGLVLYKQWIARTGDSRTRDSHAEMVSKDPIPIDQPFIVGGHQMQMPGDSNLPELVCNCRCIVSFIPASEVINPAISATPVPVVHQPSITDVISVIKPLKKVFTPAKNLLEAESFITENNISKAVDYSFIKDVRVANEVNEALFTVNERYPFRELSTIGKNTTNANAMMSANYQQININHKTFTSMNRAGLTHESSVVQYMDRINSNIDIVKQNIELSKTYKDKTYWRNKLREFQERQKYSRFTVSYGKDTIVRDSTYHELGHVLHDGRTGLINGAKAVSKNMLGANGQLNDLAHDLNRELSTLYYNSKKNGDIYKISYYSGTNEKEFFCESFVMHMNNDPALPAHIAEFIERYLKLTL